MKRILSLAIALSFCAQTLWAEFRYDHYLVQNLAFDFHQMKSPQDLFNLLGKTLREEDKRELEKNLKVLKGLPKIRYGGNTIELSSQGDKVLIDLNQAAKKVAIFNGIKVAVDPKTPLSIQVEALKKKLNAQGKGAQLIDLALPKAHAHPLILGALAFVGVALANKIIDRYGSTALDMIDSNACWLMNEKMKILSEGSAACREYLQRQKDLAAKNPEVQAVRDALREVNTNEAIDVSGEVCPHQSSDQKSYRSSIQFINRPEARARVEIKVDGNNVKEIRVLDFATDKVLATYILKDQALDKIRIPNPAAVSAANGTPDPLVPPQLEISATTDISDPILSAEQKFHKSIFAKMGQRLGACKAAADNINARTKRQQKNEGTR